MDVDTLCQTFGSEARPIKDVLREWQLSEMDGLLRTLETEHDQYIGGAVIAADAAYGDGMLDAIPKELHRAFVNLMGEKAVTYKQMRTILLGAIRSEEGGFRSFDDRQVLGFISKLKGQIGENVFKQNVGAAAELAHAGSQEAWDVAIRQADGAHEYIQVKLYASPRAVVRKMLEVQEKVDHGWIDGCLGETVDHIDFAVPADIAERVCELKQHYPQLESINVLTVPIDAGGAADIVKEGMNNVGPEQLEHFFDELLCGAVAAGSLHAIASAFLWYKGSQDFASAFADAAANTTISTMGIGVGLLAETFCQTAMLSGAIGIGGRLFLGRLARSRWSFAEFMQASVVDAQQQIAFLAEHQRRPSVA